MRTTLDLDDALLTRAKAEAARQRTTLTRLVEEGLALRLTDDVGPREQSPVRLHVSHGRGGLQPGIGPCSNASRFGAADEAYDRRQRRGRFDELQGDAAPR